MAADPSPAAAAPPPPPLSRAPLVDAPLAAPILASAPLVAPTLAAPTLATGPVNRRLLSKEAKKQAGLDQLRAVRASFKEVFNGDKDDLKLAHEILAAKQDLMTLHHHEMSVLLNLHLIALPTMNFMEEGAKKVEESRPRTDSAMLVSTRAANAQAKKKRPQNPEKQKKAEERRLAREQAAEGNEEKARDALKRNEEFEITDLLPMSARSPLERVRVYHVAPIESFLDTCKADHPAHTLFGKENLQRIRSRFLGAKGSESAGLFKMWSRLSDAVHGKLDEHKFYGTPDKMSTSATASLSGLSSHFATMWSKPGMFGRTLKCLVKCLLRAHLSPDERKQTNQPNPKPEPSLSFQQWKRIERRMQRQLKKAVKQKDKSKLSDRLQSWRDKRPIST